MNREIVINRKQSAQGFMKWAVVDSATGEVVRDSGPDWIPNLILNNGLNGIYSRYWADSFLYAIAGLGTTPTSVDSDTTNASQSGTTVTADASFFGSGDVGNMIKWDSGEEARITAFTSATSVTVANSATVGSGPFVMYNTNQTQLSNEVKRTNTYLTGSPNCMSTDTGTQVQLRRTYDFSVETGTVNYTEIGFSWTNTGANTTFSRILLPAPVQVLSGQQLRIVYELRISYAPTTPQSGSATINGWPISPATGTAGQYCIQMTGLALVSTTGATTVTNTGNEPSFISDSNSGLSCYMFLSTNSTAINSAGSAPNRAGTNPALKVLAKAAYTTNSYVVDKSGTYAVGEANSTGWRSMGYGASSPNNTFPYDTNRTNFVFLFDEAQTKPNTHTLTMTWRTTWSRTLS
jgi:hypothetical protein